MTMAIRYFLKIDIIAALTAMMLLTSCSNGDTEHRGEVRLADVNVQIDTMKITMPMLGSWGCFYMADTVITFVDGQSYKFYDFSLDGELLDTYFRRGNASDEFSAFAMAYPILEDKQNRILIEDPDLSLSIVHDKKITRLGRTDYGWDGEKHGDYRKPNIYAAQDIDAFGVSAYFESDSILVFAVNVMDRMLANSKTVSKNRFRDAATFCRLNVNTMKVESVFGHFPKLYMKKPMPQMEFLQFDVHNDTLYVNHAADPLIYVYEYPEKLLYTMGYDCEGINRDYVTITTLDRESEDYDSAYDGVGVNSGLRYFTENNTLCRVYIKKLNLDFENMKTGMQIYRDDDLIADCPMPDNFQLLGHHDGSYYGACYTPMEEGDDTSLLLYRVTVDGI